jgi:hypothetical protein
MSGWLASGLTAQEVLPREPIPVAPAAVPRDPVPVVPAPAAVADTAPRIVVDEVAEPLTRGPIHEAFAQAVTPAAEVGLIVKQEPPPLIDELPPAQRPAGDDIAWIPGYWGWDDDLKDYIWISGIWRAMPPGREWVPGYWVQTTEGFQWISGYWADLRNEEVEYLPPPPETVDAGPNTPAPTGDEIWVPGTWMWQQNKYVWRAGYWALGNPRWLWTNAHYVYTPRGYLYVSGYWDFLLPQRGVLFTPVYFRNVPRNYVYSPRLVVNTTALVSHLFLRPTYRHYYFGDYYAANYRGRGILPYFVFHDSRHGFDSIYSYYRWHNRNDRDWDRQVVARYEELRDREDRRPPRDFTTWRQYRDNDPNRDRNPLLINSLQDFTRLQGHELKFRDLDDAARQSAGRYWKDLDTYRQTRIKTEAERALRVGDENRGGDRVRLLKPPTSEVQRDFGPGREERRPADLGRPADTGRTAVEGKVTGEAGRNPRDVPGPLNDIRDRKADTPKGPARTDPDGDGRPGVKSLRTLPGDDSDLPAKTPKPVPGISDRPAPGVLPKSPREVPKSETVVPPPREVPKVTRPQPEAPRAVPPRDPPRVNPDPPRVNPDPPRVNPQPPRNERPQGGNAGNKGGNKGGGNPGGGNPGGGNPGGGNPGKGKRE